MPRVSSPEAECQSVRLLTRPSRPSLSPMLPANVGGYFPNALSPFKERKPECCCPALSEPTPWTPPPVQPVRDDANATSKNNYWKVWNAIERDRTEIGTLAFTGFSEQALRGNHPRLQVDTAGWKDIRTHGHTDT